MQSVSECSKMYAECMQIHEFACSYICLLAGPWACMQFLSMSEQLTRISQCFFLQDQWEKLLAVSICCCMIYVCYKELAIAGCKWFWCYLMQLLDEVGFPTPISNEVCDGIMRPGRMLAQILHDEVVNTNYLKNRETSFKRYFFKIFCKSYNVINFSFQPRPASGAWPWLCLYQGRWRLPH